MSTSSNTRNTNDCNPCTSEQAYVLIFNTSGHLSEAKIAKCCYMFSATYLHSCHKFKTRVQQKTQYLFWHSNIYAGISTTRFILTLMSHKICICINWTRWANPVILTGRDIHVFYFQLVSGAFLHSSCTKFQISKQTYSFIHKILVLFVLIMCFNIVKGLITDFKSYFLHRRNGFSGRMCMLRFLCEATQLVIPTDTLFQKLLKLIFT